MMTIMFLLQQITFFGNLSDKIKVRRVIQNHWFLEPIPRELGGPSAVAYGPPNQFNLKITN